MNPGERAGHIWRRIRKAIAVGIALSIATTVLIPFVMSIGEMHPTSWPLYAVFTLAPGYMSYAWLHEKLVGPMNVHLDAIGWIGWGLLLNTLIWIVICVALRAAYAWRSAPRRGERSRPVVRR